MKTLISFLMRINIRRAEESTPAVPSRASKAAHPLCQQTRLGSAFKYIMKKLRPPLSQGYSPRFGACVKGPGCRPSAKITATAAANREW